MKYDVLYFSQAPWKVGERQADRDARLKARGPADLRDIYPGYFPGRVISVCEHPFTPGETIDPARAVKVMYLNDVELAQARARDVRVEGDRLVPVTFDECHGARAAALKEAFPLDFAVREEEEQAGILAAHGRNYAALQAFKEDLAAWEEEKLSAAELGLVLETPRPAAPEYEPVPEPEFADLADRLARALPPTQVHTGAGLYKVDDDGDVHNDTIAGLTRNLLLQSQAFDVTANWVKYNCTVTADQIVAPDGTATADKIVDDGGSAFIREAVAGGVLTDNAQYAWSVFVHVGDAADMTLSVKDDVAPAYRAQVDFAWTDGALSVSAEDIGTGSVEDCGGGWWRATVVVPVNVIIGANAHSCYFWPTRDGGGDTGKYVYAWGAQLEEGAFPSAYIPTTTAIMHAALLTTGGLIEDERNGEVFISGGNSYVVIKNYAAQVNVAGDPSAEAGACTISPYTTVQSAVDQLWTDQGSAGFTATQELRIYDGTYNEAVTLPSTFKPMWNFPLVIRAATGETAVVVTNSGIASHTFSLTYTPRVLFEGIEVRTEYAAMAALYLCGYNNEIKECVFVSAGGGQCLDATRRLSCRDSAFSTDSAGYIISSGHSYKRCVFRGGKCLDGVGHSSFRGCIFDGTGLVPWVKYTGQFAPGQPLELLNCTAYNLGGDFIESMLTSSNYYIAARIRNCVFHTIGGYVFDAGDGAYKGGILVDSDRNCFYNCTKIARVDGVDYADLAAWRALVDDWGQSPDAASFEADPKLTDPAGDDFSLAADSPCRHSGCGAGVAAGYLGTAFDPFHPDIGAAATGTVEAPARPSVEMTGVDGPELTLSVSGEDDASNFAELVSARTGEVADEDSREGDGALTLVAPAIPARYFALVWSANAAGRSGPAGPLEVFLPAGESPFEEVRVALVAKLRSHAGLQETLGTDDTGAVPIYAARPGLPVRVPSIVYTLEGTPDSELDRAGRWLMKLAVEARGGSPGVNDTLLSAMDEVLSRRPFECTSWSVKRIRRTGDGTRWTDDGRTESRRTEWVLVVDRLGS